MNDALSIEDEDERQALWNLECVFEREPSRGDELWPTLEQARAALADFALPMTAPRRRWSRFSLRTMLVVVTLVGGWLGWERHVVNGRAGVRQDIENAGGTFYTGDFVPGPFPRPAPQPPSWIRRQLGDESVGLIDLHHEQWDVKMIKSWFPEADLCGTETSDGEESSDVQEQQP